MCATENMKHNMFKQKIQENRWASHLAMIHLIRAIWMKLNRLIWINQGVRDEYFTDVERKNVFFFVLNAQLFGGFPIFML